MGRTSTFGKTIGEVESITGIPKRELKYYIEQKLMRPSLQSDIGYWLYDPKDIQTAQLISLCRELAFAPRAIRIILSDPDLNWRTQLERQIALLEKQRDHAEAQLRSAKQLLNYDVWGAVQFNSRYMAETAQKQD